MLRIFEGVVMQFESDCRALEAIAKPLRSDFEVISKQMIVKRSQNDCKSDCKAIAQRMHSDGKAIAKSLWNDCEVIAEPLRSDRKVSAERFRSDCEQL